MAHAKDKGAKDKHVKKKAAKSIKEKRAEKRLSTTPPPPVRRGGVPRRRRPRRLGRQAAGASGPPPRGTHAGNQSCVRVLARGADGRVRPPRRSRRALPRARRDGRSDSRPRRQHLGRVRGEPASGPGARAARSGRASHSSSMISVGGERVGHAMPDASTVADVDAVGPVDPLARPGARRPPPRFGGNVHPRGDADDGFERDLQVERVADEDDGRLDAERVDRGPVPSRLPPPGRPRRGMPTRAEVLFYQARRPRSPASAHASRSRVPSPRHPRSYPTIDAVGVVDDGLAAPRRRTPRPPSRHGRPSRGCSHLHRPSADATAGITSSLEPNPAWTRVPSASRTSAGADPRRSSSPTWRGTPSPPAASPTRC